MGGGAHSPVAARPLPARCVDRVGAHDRSLDPRQTLHDVLFAVGLGEAAVTPREGHGIVDVCV